MAASIFPQICYNHTVTVGSNDRVDFVDAGSTYAATLNAGSYSPGAFAGECQRAMRAIQGGTHNSVSYNPITAQFTLTGTSTFSLLWSSGANHATTAANLLGFAANADNTLATTYTGSAMGTVFSGGQLAANTQTGTLWTLAEPTEYSSPCVAGTESGLATGVAATGLRRSVRVTQNISDGAAIESIYFSTLTRYGISFNSLTAAEAVNMESLLNWIVQGKPFCYQPDKTTALALRLKLDLGTDYKIDPDFTWTTRPEVSYGKLAFLQDVIG